MCESCKEYFCSTVSQYSVPTLLLSSTTASSTIYAAFPVEHISSSCSIDDPLMSSVSTFERRHWFIEVWNDHIQCDMCLRYSTGRTLGLFKYVFISGYVAQNVMH